VIGFTAFLAHLLVIALTEQDAVRLPVIAVGGAFEVLQGDLAQQSSKGGLTAITNYVSNNLRSTLTKSRPWTLYVVNLRLQPLFVFLAAAKAAQLVKLKYLPIG